MSNERNTVVYAKSLKKILLIGIICAWRSLSIRRRRLISKLTCRKEPSLVRAERNACIDTASIELPMLSVRLFVFAKPCGTATRGQGRLPASRRRRHKWHPRSNPGIYCPPRAKSLQSSSKSVRSRLFRSQPRRFHLRDVLRSILSLVQTERYSTGIFQETEISRYGNIAKSPGIFVQKLNTTNISSYSFLSSLVRQNTNY